MAVNHSTLWGKIGKLIKNSNSLSTLASTTMPASLQEIVSQYGTTLTGISTSQLPIEGLNSTYADLMQTIQGVRLTLLSFADTTVVDYDTIASQLTGVSSQDLGTILHYLIEDMVINSQSVERSVVSLGSVSAASMNIGDGTVLLDATLDGVTSPLSGGPAHRRYQGRLSELAPPSAIHVFECAGDSYGGGSTEGAESFLWLDGTDFGELSPFGEAAGAGPGLTVAGHGFLVSNGNFENWSDDVPDSWSLEVGTAGVNCYEETGNVFRGDSCLAMTGDGTTEEPVSLTYSFGTLTPRRRYCITLRARLMGATPTAGVLGASLDGTNYTTESGTESIQQSLTGLSSSTWTLCSFYVNVPPNPPDDLVLTLKLRDTPTNGTIVLVDSLTMDAVTYHAGINACIVPGRIPFAAGDRLQATVTNTEKVIQRFCRTHWKVQLPSGVTTTGSYFTLLPTSLFTTTGAVTISDSLAT